MGQDYWTELAELIRKTVRLPAPLWKMLEQRAEKAERSLNYVLIQAVASYVSKPTPDVGEVVSDVGEVVSQRHHSDTTVVSHPDPARAGTDSSEKVSEREYVPRSVEEIWRTTEPFCLLDDPIKRLRLLREMFPGEDIGPHSAAIAMWWDERDYPPKGRKRKKDERWLPSGISAGIRGWVSRNIERRNSQPQHKPSQSTMFNGQSNETKEVDWYKNLPDPDAVDRADIARLNGQSKQGDD